MNFRDILREVIFDVLRFEELYSVVGEVSNISESKRTCDVQPKDDSAMIRGVRLQSSQESSKGLVLIPKDKSDVTVTFMNKDTGYVSQTNEIQKIIGVIEDDGEVDLKVKNTRLQMDKDGIKFNDGNLGGLTVLSKVVERLNKIEQDSNTLKSAFNSWTVTPQDGGAGLKGAAGAWFAQQLATTTENDVKNDKVKQ